MALTLTLEGGPAPVTDRTRRIARGQLRLGRGAENDWVLHDPVRYLSKHHCTIAERSGEWWITDESTNGVFVDDQAKAARARQLGPAARRQLGTHGRLSPARSDRGVGRGIALVASDLRPDAPADRPEPAPAPPRTTGGVFETEWRRRWSTDEPEPPARSPALRRPSSPIRVPSRSWTAAGPPSARNGSAGLNEARTAAPAAPDGLRSIRSTCGRKRHRAPRPRRPRPRTWMQAPAALCSPIAEPEPAPAIAAARPARRRRRCSKPS